MQTFLSEPSFKESAQALDNVRLNKQLLEGRQILYAISITPDGGGSRVEGKVPFASNHPVTNQWRGCEYRLVNYLSDVKKECDSRGIATEKNWTFILDLFKSQPWSSIEDPHLWPDWWTDPTFQNKVITTHRHNLYNKDPLWYASYEAEGTMLDTDLMGLVCCPGKHAPYYYPAHMEA